jgi:hypothetical protein
LISFAITLLISSDLFRTIDAATTDLLMKLPQSRTFSGSHDYNSDGHSLSAKAFFTYEYIWFVRLRPISPINPMILKRILFCLQMTLSGVEVLP